VRVPLDVSTLRPLGRTGLRVQPLCIGCAQLGDMPETFAYSVAEAQALETYHAILDGPIRFLDTAAAYGDGESERRLGLVLRARGGLPAGFVLGTKADRDLHTGDFSGEQVRRSVEGSLRRLGLSRLELCYLHDPEHTTFEAAMAPAGPVEALRRCRDEGLIAHLGVAGGPIPMMIRYVETGLFEAAISHNRHTLLNRSAEPLWDVCAHRGVAALNAAPYGSGILAKGPGTYARYAYQDAAPEVVARARRLQELCAAAGVPLGAAALQLSLRDPRIVSTIVGISRPERLAQTTAWAEHPIPEDLWAELERAVPPESVDPEAARWAGGG
jgi:D-threo-aldose 1-dehydrogenase